MFENEKYRSIKRKENWYNFICALNMCVRAAVRVFSFLLFTSFFTFTFYLFDNNDDDCALYSLDGYGLFIIWHCVLCVYLLSCKYVIKLENVVISYIACRLSLSSAAAWYGYNTGLSQFGRGLSALEPIKLCDTEICLAENAEQIELTEHCRYVTAHAYDFAWICMPFAVACC